MKDDLPGGVALTHFYKDDDAKDIIALTHQEL